LAPVALQPVQLVSMELAPGVTEKPTFEEFAVPITPPQPAAMSSAGASSIGKFMKYRRMGKVSTYILATYKFRIPYLFWYIQDVHTAARPLFWIGSSKWQNAFLTALK
jgi:hypothetical protein